MKKTVYITIVLASLVFINDIRSENLTGCKEKFLDYKGYKIHYQLYGDGNFNKTLVFVHGWCGNINVWKHQLKAFPNYKVIAIDLPGHGKSSKEPDQDYNIELFVNSIHAVLYNEKVGEAFIFGHSMGFAVAEIFALKYPEKTIGIGSIDGAHFEVESDEKSQSEWIAYNKAMAETMNEEKGREDFISLLFLPETPTVLKHNILKDSKNTPLSIGKKIISSMSDDMSFWEKRVMNIPCFVIHSPVYQLTDNYKHDFMKMYPNAEYYEMDGVSHFLMLEVPDKLNKMMHSYLKKVY